MNIALISSFNKPTNINVKSGQEVWTAEFLKEAIRRDLTFDLYGIKGSIEVENKIRLIQILNEGMDEMMLDPFFQNRKEHQRDNDFIAAKTCIKLLLEIKEKQSEYDLVIESTGRALIGLSWGEHSKPLVIIGHAPVQRPYVNFYKYFPLPPNAYFVFPSKLQYDTCTWIPASNKFIIPHGIPLPPLADQSLKKDRLLWLGRYDPDMLKGLEESIEVANRLQLPLDIQTKIEPDFKDIFDNQVLPKINQNPQITLNTKVSEKIELYQQTKLFLYPAMWEEPFGLVLPETMATGTPIVAFARGAIPEIIKDGETGFIVNPSDDDIRGDWIIKKTGIEGLIEAVQRIYALPQSAYEEMRRNAREHVEKNFTIEKMVDQYEEVFKQILDQKSS